MLYHPSMKTFDVFLNKAIKTLLVVNIIIMLTIGAFFVQPVYAASSLPVLDNPSNSDVVNADFLGVEMSWGARYFFACNSDRGQIAFFRRNDSQFQYVYLSDILPTDFYYAFTSGSSTGPLNTFTLNSDNHYATNDTWVFSISDISVNNIPVYDTLEDAIASYNPVSSDNIYEGFRLPPGYSARIQVSSGGHFDVSCTMGELCATSGTWIDNTQKYLFSDSAAVGSALESGTLINWAPSGNLTAYGQTYEAFYSFSSVPSGTYMWITNPVYMNVANQYLDNPSINGTIVLSNVVNVQQIRLFPLSTDVGKSGIGSFGSDDDYYNAVESNGAIIYEGSDGSVSSSLPDYGNTNVPGSSGNQGIIERFQSLLEDLVSRIESLLIAPVSYIQRIISAGSTFFTWLSGLWSWLPAPVSGIITSVLYVMAVVGGLKLLWR